MLLLWKFVMLKPRTNNRLRFFKVLTDLSCMESQVSGTMVSKMNDLMHLKIHF